MKSFCVEIITQTASFRNPEFQNFHKSLSLPPPTTIIGLAGAALGLSPKMAQDFFERTPFQIGITGKYEGKTIDTWKYNKRTKNMHWYDSLLDGGIIHRELLIHNHFLLVFASSEDAKLQELKNAFLNPVFALTMGNSDSLAMIKSIQDNPSFFKSDKLENCLVAGDVVGEVLYNASNGLKFSIYQSSEPISHNLPVRFEYISDYGKRKVSGTSIFSFIGNEMLLNYEIEGVLYNNVFIPIFDL